MRQRLDTSALAQLFNEARTYNAWHKKDVPKEILIDLVQLMKWGPTSVNMSPMRIVFLK